ncbi:MAG: PA0069 family radical SAM protein [Magnetovibrio sp.]|nr:PA0069 family radical SAM protein [Magnetovibrio sp.]
MIDELPTGPHKGRAAVSNTSGRFETTTRVAVDDGWGFDEDKPKLKTDISIDTARTALTRNSSPDIPFDRSLNPYRGCEHGCIYCYARTSHAYMNLSPGLDFETKLFVKKDFATTLERELRKPGYTPAPVMIGSNTDAYQPIERDFQVTRQVLEVLQAYRHPVAVITKSHLITRDIDILAEMAQDNLVTVAVSITTLDHKMANTMEPRASAPHRRLKTIETLSQAGIPVTVMAAPMIPTLNDHELENIFAAAREAGATSAAYILVRLPLELKELFQEWLETFAPHKTKRVMSLLSQSRDGHLNDANFHSRMTGTGVHAKLLNQRYHLACKKLGLKAADCKGFHLNTKAFKCPPKPGDQLGLF